MSRFVWIIRYVRWWRKRLEDWDRKRDTKLFYQWAESWIDPDNFDALGENPITPEDAAWEDASNA